MSDVKAGEGSFDPASRGTLRTLPSTPVQSSVEIGWDSMLAERHVVRPGRSEFETSPTSDAHLVLRLRGPHRVEALSGGSWEGLTVGAGSSQLLPGGTAERMRISTPEPIELLHLFIPRSTVDDVAAQLRSTGRRVSPGRLRRLHVADPTLNATGQGLIRALQAGVPDLYAERAARWLAMHALAVYAEAEDATRPDSTAPAADERVSRTVALIRRHFDRPLTLDELAAEAGVSKFHFVRLFRQQTGSTPAAFVAQVRLAASRRLLTDSDLTVAEIARRSGYSSADQFAAAFRRAYRVSPSRFRRSTSDDRTLGAPSAVSARARLFLADGPRDHVATRAR